MFESILSYRDVERKPWLMFLWAVVLASVAILIAAQISYRVPVAGEWLNLSGLFSVLFVIIPSAYYLTQWIKREELLEEGEIKRHHRHTFWARHGEYIMITMFFFVGLTIAFSVWAFALPGDFFQVQTSKIGQIQGQVTGELTHADFGSFTRILSNNLQVMVFAFLFSLFFGAGAVFIIAWNASILGVYISQLSRHVLEIPWWGLFFLPHGIPEIGGYLVAGLAGGIVSAAILRKNDKGVLKVIAIDAIKLFAIAFALILAGAAIEVYL
jgi:uncharacterized membrane protein SpoIIM required for sporulation